MNKRIAIFIDGGNFYGRMKEINLRKLLGLHYDNLAKFLARDYSIVQSRYYIGVVRAKQEDVKARKIMADQQKLFHRLQKFGWHLVRGQIIKIHNAYHEKGVDVHIAVDLISGAYEDIYDRACVVSSDTDLIPAFEKVIQLGKEIEYIGFSHKPSFAMIQSATTSRLLAREDIFKFLPPQS